MWFLNPFSDGHKIQPRDLIFLNMTIMDSIILPCVFLELKDFKSTKVDIITTPCSSRTDVLWVVMRSLDYYIIWLIVMKIALKNGSEGTRICEIQALTEL